MIQSALDAQSSRLTRVVNCKREDHGILRINKIRNSQNTRIHLFLNLTFD